MIYRKHGMVVRWENGTRIRVTESGAARETGDLFECWPIESPDIGFDADAAAASLDQVAARATAIRLERLILSEGHAQHEYGERRWSEHTRRLHASLTNGTLRALVDQATFDLAQIDNIAEALQRAEENEAEAPKRIVLAPNVAAAILPLLPDVVQAAGGTDGYGNPVVEARGEWPSFFRPSYRFRPVRMPHNLRLDRESSEIDPSLPRAIALLAPPERGALRVLVVDGERVFPSTVPVRPVAAAGPAGEWYPFGAGSFGAEMVL